LYLRTLGYLTVGETARLLKVHRTAVYRSLKAGDVLGLQDSGAFYIHWDAARECWGDGPPVPDPPGLRRDAGALPASVQVLGATQSELRARIARLQHALERRVSEETLRRPADKPIGAVPVTG